MAFTTYTLTGNVADLIGNDYVPADVVIELKASDPVVSDGVSQTRFGKVQASPAADGTFQIAGIPSSVNGPLYAITILWGPPNKKIARSEAVVAWFEMTSNDTLAAVVERTVTPVMITPSVAADISAAEGYAAQAAASAALADSYIVADLNTSDGQMEALIESPTSLTQAALSATYGPETGPAAGVPDSFIANGIGNSASVVVARATDPLASHVEGFQNRAHGWYAHAEGAGCIADGKIPHVEGNACICTANDAHAEGNRTVAGRRYYGLPVGTAITTGSEDAGSGLGVMQYVLIPADEGDATSYFPNALTDTVTTRYGAGAQKDSVGNIYPVGMTPAVWAGDTLITANNLQWAMHRVAIVRGANEDEIDFVTIAKATWTVGVGTKVYYRGVKPFVTLIAIYSSYAATVAVNGVLGGNGTHSEGLFTTAVGYGAHSEGNATRAWDEGAHAEGRLSKALAKYSHSEGFSTKVTGIAGHAEGEGTEVTGDWGHGEGYQCLVTGLAGHSEGYQCRTLGNYAHSQNEGTKATGARSHAEGFYTEALADSSRAAGAFSVATRFGQDAFALYARFVAGDDQISRIAYSKFCVDVGWHDVSLIEALANDRTYLFETTVIGRQTAGATGAVGDSFAYKFQGAVTTVGGVMTEIGTPTRTLVGRTAGMSGDGLTTGARLMMYSPAYPAGGGIGSLSLRYDGEVGRTVYISTQTKFQEVG